MPEEKKKETTEGVPKAPAEAEDHGSGTGTEEGKVEFTDPALKGKSPKEIEALLRMSKQVVDGQKNKVRGLEDRIKDLESKPPAPPVPEKKEDFFTNPDSAMQRLEDKLVATIAPLRTELKEARQDLAVQGLEERMAAKFDDWHEVRPWIDQMLAKQDFPNPNDEGLLGTLYYTAVGMRTKEGITSTAKPKEVTEVPGANVHRGPIPQHRSSPPPPPPAKPAASGEVSLDDFDETERAMCKYYKMTPGEFREFQEMNPEDVAESTVGLKKKEA